MLALAEVTKNEEWKIKAKEESRIAWFQRKGAGGITGGFCRSSQQLDQQIYKWILVSRQNIDLVKSYLSMFSHGLHRNAGFCQSRSCTSLSVKLPTAASVSRSALRLLSTFVHINKIAAMTKRTAAAARFKPLPMG